MKVSHGFAFDEDGARQRVIADGEAFHLDARAEPSQRFADPARTFVDIGDECDGFFDHEITLPALPRRAIDGRES